MTQALVKILAALTLTTAVSIASLPAVAGDKSYDERIALAYAPEDTADQGQFDQFELHGTYEDAHELNDGWLGMPVRDSAGKVVGYVEDAYLDDEGYLNELVVSLNGSGVAVYIDQINVEYTEVAVLVDMPIQAIASLERVSDTNIQ